MIDNPQDIYGPEPERPNGHGGKRSNAGGKRAGAGRKRKPVPPKPQPSVLQPRLRAGPFQGNAFYIRGTGRTVGNSIVRPRLLTTSGTLGKASEAFIYVGVRRSDGIIKIGMSSQPDKRCRCLAAELVFTVPVVVASAKLVETYAFQELGVLSGKTEYVRCAIDRAIDAVCVAWRAAEKLAHVDPTISADEARKMRIQAAA